MKIAAFYENILEAVQKENRTLESVLALLKAEGLEEIYISGDSLIEGGAALLQTFAALELPVAGVHQHFDFGHQPDQEWKSIVDTAKAAGARNFLVVPGLFNEDEPDRALALDRMLEAIPKIVDYGREIGIDICMEDYDNLRSPFNSIAGLERFFQREPRLKCAFDTGNFVCYDEDPLKAYERFEDAICILHLKDRAPRADQAQAQGCLCADGRVAPVAATGYGIMPIAQILDRVRESGKEITGVVELYGAENMLDALRKSVAWVKGQLA